MKRSLVVTLCLVQFVDVLGVTSGTTAIPSIVRALSAPPSSAAILGSAYPAAFGAFLVLGARAGERFGHRRLVLVGVAAFGVVGIAGSFAPVVEAVAAARALQGLAAAVTVPSALRLLLASAPQDPARRSALGLWTASGATAGACGFLVGGVLTQIAGWPAVLWIAGPVAAALLALLVPLTASLAADRHPALRLGLPGGTLLVVAVGCLVLGASFAERTETRGAGLEILGAGVLIGLLLVAQQRRSRVPLLPAGGLRNRNLRTGVIASFVNTATTSPVAVLATVELQTSLQLPPLIAGLALLPTSIGAILGGLLSPRLGSVLPPPRVAAVGLATIVAGDLGFALVPPSIVGTMAATSVVGLGLGVASVPATAIGTDVPPELVGGSTGAVSTAAQLGTAIGVTCLVVLAGATSTDVADVVAAVLAGGTALALLR